MGYYYRKGSLSMKKKAEKIYLGLNVGTNSIGYAVGASTLARNKNYYKPQKCGLFYVKFYLFLCCTELYFIFICDIMRYETQL